MATTLITGATGFLGRRVLELLVARQERVVVFGRRSVASTLPLSSGAQLEFVPGDLATGAGLDRILWSEIDGVIHLAAAGVKASRRQWDEAIPVNVLGTQRLLQAITRHARRTPPVFVARTFYEDAIEEIPALRQNAYVVTKAAATRIARWWGEDYPGALILGTLFQIYGPGDDPGAVLSYAARSLKTGAPCTFGSGLGQRDWLYVDEAASAVLACVAAAKPGLSDYDIGSGILRSLRDMVLNLVQIARADPALVTFDPARDRDDMALRRKAGRLPSGWRSVVTVEAGLRQLFHQV